MMGKMGCDTLWYGNQDVGGSTSKMFWSAEPEMWQVERVQVWVYPG